MFQVVLISALSTAVLFATVAWSARLRRGLSVPNEARRGLVALERASWTTIRQRMRQMPLSLGGALCLVLTLQFLLPLTASERSPWLIALGVTLTLTSGAVFALGLALLCGYHTRKHAFLGVAAAAQSLDRCLGVYVSASAAITVAAEVLGMLLTLAAHGLLWLLFRGTVDAGAGAASAQAISAELSFYFGIGAVIAALILQHCGIASVAAARFAGTFGFENRTLVSALDPRNPTVLISAVSRQLGGLVPAILDAFVSGSLVAALTLELMSVATRQGWTADATGVAMIPFLTRGFGLVASLFGLLTLRASEHEEPRTAFIRGQLVAHIVLTAAVIGIVVWLVGSVSWPVVAAATIALVLVASLGHARAYLLGRAKTRRHLADEIQGTSLVATLTACSAGLSIAILPLFAYAALCGLFVCWFQNSAIGDAQRAAAVLLGLTIPSALTAWHRVAAVSRELSAIGMFAANVGHVALSDEASLRLRKVTDATERVRTLTEPVLSDSNALFCVLVAIVCQVSHVHAPTGSAATVAVLGLVTLVVLPGLLALIESLTVSARSTRTQLNEIDRQMRGMRREGSRILVPPDFVPSYRSCVELLARDSAHGGLTSTFLAIGLPVLSARMGVAAENTAGSMALGLALYAAIAATVGLFVAQVGHAAAGAAFVAQRGSVSVRNSAAQSSASVSEPLHLVEFLGHSLNVSAPLLTKAAALVTLAFSASLP